MGLERNQTHEKKRVGVKTSMDNSGSAIQAILTIRIRPSKYGTYKTVKARFWPWLQVRVLEAF